jgi:hypothetical protein
MSKRLQVLLPDDEMTLIERLAKREQVTVGSWVRRALREASEQKSPSDAEARLRAIRRAAGFSFPTGDIEQILNEIERGYQA